MPWRRPWRTYRYIIIEADTRPLELFLSGFAFIWGGWLLFGGLGGTLETKQLTRAIDVHGGHFVWAGWCLMNSFCQAISVWLHYPRFRRWASTVCAIFWIFVTYCLLKSDIRLFPAPMSGFMALGQLWIVLHRNAINADDFRR